jgi:tRNA A-37 threonylcarbamoyl transferase component Bud32
MSDEPGDLEKTRTVAARDLSTWTVPDAAFQNDLLAAWLDDLDQGRVRDVTHYQALFPGRESAVAAELARLERGDADDRDGAIPKIPDVEILEKIGSGGQGVVYRGRQTYVDREVAVKVFAPKFWSESFTERFHREAKTLAALRHPNIVACYQAGATDAGLGFMVMEFVDGPNLRQWLAQNGPMTPVHALSLCRDLARALEHAQDAAIIHRDVKPENVLLRPLPKPSAGGLPFEVKLADLGLARVGTRLVGGDEGGGDATTQLTPVGAVMGSPLTMAPEQFDDPENVDFRADIYGLGCVLFHAIAGRSAFQSTQLTAVIQEKVGAAAPDVREVESSVAPEVASFIQSMLAADPEARPDGHADVAEGCEQLLRAPQVRTARRTLIAAVVVVVVSAIALGAWDPLGMVHPPTVVIVATKDASEGQPITLVARADGRGDLTFSWKQIGKPRVRLSDPNDATVTFLAPRGVGEHAFEFAVTVANRWLATTQTERVLVRGSPELAPLPRGETRSLLRGDESQAVADWRKAEDDVGTWEGATGHVGANGYCNSGTTRQTRFLPRGRWVLSGAIEPFHLAYLQTGMARTERAGLQLAFSSGHIAELVVRRVVRGDEAREGFVAGVGHRLANAPETTRLESPIEGTWTEKKPLAFEIEWTGTALRFSYGSGKGAADWVHHAIEARSLPTAFPPNALTIFVDHGQACFCKLRIEGR